MAQGLELDVKQVVLVNGTFGSHEINQLEEAMTRNQSCFGELRDAVAELGMQSEVSPANALKRGVCCYLLGRFSQAVDILQSVEGGVAKFYLAKSCSARGDFTDALVAYELAAHSGYDVDACVLGRVEALRNAGEPQAALDLLDSLSGAVEQTAHCLFQRAATIADIGGNPQEVTALLERAVEINGDYPGSLFGLALQNDRHGNDDVALDLYERAASKFPHHVGTLLNLGLLYEDLLQFDRARLCYQQILDVYPNHDRARLFLKDVDASRDMYYDEEAQRRRDRLSQVLSVPVADFELSVRSRNCLQKMGMETLGDLTRTSEQELLASKNFGETSLVEIREMLHSKGLDLGQFSHERHEEEPPYQTEVLSPDAQALLDRPISDLNLSVRARKCMVRLGITTISDLVRRTGDDLLECKNFGVTSLNEVREKLVLQDLKLRGD